MLWRKCLHRAFIRHHSYRVPRSLPSHRLYHNSTFLGNNRSWVQKFSIATSSSAMASDRFISPLCHWHQGRTRLTVVWLAKAGGPGNGQILQTASMVMDLQHSQLPSSSFTILPVRARGLVLQGHGHTVSRHLQGAMPHRPPHLQLGMGFLTAKLTEVPT